MPDNVNLLAQMVKNGKVVSIMGQTLVYDRKVHLFGLWTWPMLGQEREYRELDESEARLLLADWLEQDYVVS